MAIQALNLHDVKEISHPSDKTDPTIWVIGAVDSRVLATIQDKATDIQIDTQNPDGEAGIRINQNEANIKKVQFGLRGFVNFSGEKGEVSFKTETKHISGKPYDVCADEVLASIPTEVLNWLSDEISKLNSITSKDAKK